MKLLSECLNKINFDIISKVTRGTLIVKVAIENTEFTESISENTVSTLEPKLNTYSK